MLIKFHDMFLRTPVKARYLIPQIILKNSKIYPVRMPELFLTKNVHANHIMLARDYIVNHPAQELCYYIYQNISDEYAFYTMVKFPVPIQQYFGFMAKLVDIFPRVS